MQNDLFEASLVTALFLGYLFLWKIRKRIILKNRNLNAEVIFSDNRPTQKFFAQFSRVLTAVVIILIVVHGMGGSTAVGFYRVELIDSTLFDFIGFSMGVLGLLLCLMAQIEMGTNWRVGIDKAEEIDLVTKGVFKFIRNPTYSGLFTLIIGVWVIFPTMAFMIWGISFYISIEFQVRIEEEFLTELHGESYINYSLNTKRYIPLIY